MLDTLIAYMKEFFEEKNQQTTKNVRRDEKILHAYTVWDISQFMTNDSIYIKSSFIHACTAIQWG